MIDYNISKYIDTDDDIETLNNADAENVGIDNTDIDNTGIDNADNAEIGANTGADAENVDTSANAEKDKMPDILGNNKLGYNIWDTIVKGV